MAESTKSVRARISSVRASELAELAEGVVETHCADGAIDPEAIIRRKKISLCFDHYEDAFDGMLEYEDGQFFIHCNLDRDNLPGSARGRFTLAHELGHYFIDEHRNNLVSGQVPPHPSCSDRALGELFVEREADFFASRLLLPESRFQKAVRRLPVGLAGVKAVSESFNVSLSCAAVRCVAAEVFPSVLIKWSREGFCWKWCSHSFWDYGYRRTIQSPERLPHDSATARCRNGGVEAGQIVESTTTAAFVFPSINQRSFQNIVLREESLSLGKYGTMTLITLRQPFPKEVIEARTRELGLDE
jgi:Zn-dependent peptidase ImmA (M78 family)